MRVTLHDPSDLPRLRELVARERNAKQRDRYRVVLLAAEGLGGRELTREEIAAAVGRSRQFVDEWVKRYRHGCPRGSDGGSAAGGLVGVDALRARKQPGRAPFLTPQQKHELGEALDAGPQEGIDPRSTFFGEDVRALIARRFGKLYSLRGVYKLLDSMDFSWVCPRPRHPSGYAAAPPAEQEAMKKKWPTTWRRPGTRHSPPAPAPAS